MKLDLKFTIISGSVGLRPARRIAQSKLWSGVNIVGGYDNWEEWEESAPENYFNSTNLVGFF